LEAPFLSREEKFSWPEAGSGYDAIGGMAVKRTSHAAYDAKYQLV